MSSRERINSIPERGISSVGRAPALQAGGHEFESRILHLIIKEKSLVITMYLENRIQEIELNILFNKTSEVIVINRVMITNTFEENESKK